MNEKEKEFIIKPEHIKLAKRMNVGWDDAEYGAPEIDPKRPYGNSDVEHDIAEILWDIKDCNEELTDEMKTNAATIHKEMEDALQILLKFYGEIKPFQKFKHVLYEWEKA